MYVVRPVQEEEWRALRSVRTAALTDAPSAFGSTLAESRRLTAEHWRARARGSPTRRMFMAWLGGAPVGLAGAIDEEDGSAQLVSVWVHPDHRGRGVARQLSTAALAFAIEAGLRPVRLWVTDGNNSARALYESLGFAPTGRRQPLPSDPTLREKELELRAGPPGAPAGDHPLG